MRIGYYIHNNCVFATKYGYGSKGTNRLGLKTGLINSDTVPPGLKLKMSKQKLSPQNAIFTIKPNP